MVREALTHASPSSFEDGMLTLLVSESSVHLEGLERNKEFVARTISAVMGGPVHVAYQSTPLAGEVPRPPEAQRLDRDSDRDERLRHYRRKDPALDAVVGTIAQQKVIRAFEYGPAGNTSGNVKWSGNVLITSYTISSPVGDVVTFNLGLQLTGDVTRGTFA